MNRPAVCTGQRGRHGWRRRNSTPIDGQQAPGYGLFPGGVGNRQKDPARFASLYDDVATKIFGRLPDATRVTGPRSDTTPGVERPHLAEWRERGW